ATAAVPDQRGTAGEGETPVERDALIQHAEWTIRIAASGRVQIAGPRRQAGEPFDAVAIEAELRDVLGTIGISQHSAANASTEPAEKSMDGELVTHDSRAQSGEGKPPASQLKLRITRR